MRVSFFIRETLGLIVLLVIAAGVYVLGYLVSFSENPSTALERLAASEARADTPHGGSGSGGMDCTSDCTPGGPGDPGGAGGGGADGSGGSVVGGGSPDGQGDSGDW